MGHHIVYRQLLLGVLPGESDLYEQPPGHALSLKLGITHYLLHHVDLKFSPSFAITFSIIPASR